MPWIFLPISTFFPHSPSMIQKLRNLFFSLQSKLPVCLLCGDRLLSYIEYVDKSQHGPWGRSNEVAYLEGCGSLLRWWFWMQRFCKRFSSSTCARCLFLPCKQCCCPQLGLCQRLVRLIELETTWWTQRCMQQLKSQMCLNIETRCEETWFKMNVNASLSILCRGGMLHVVF